MSFTATRAAIQRSIDTEYAEATLPELLAKGERMNRAYAEMVATLGSPAFDTAHQMFREAAASRFDAPGFSTREF